MRLYRISATGDFGAEQAKAIWVGRKRDIPAACREIRDATYDECEPLVEELDVPTTKHELLGFLNIYADGGV